MLEEELSFQGDKFFSEGKFSDAEGIYGELIDDFSRFFSLGVMHFSLGEDHLAFKNFSNAFENASGDEKILVGYAKGRTLYELGDYKNAKINLENVLDDLNGDVKEDAERMLKRMKFGFLNKVFGKAKNLAVNNPHYSLLAVLSGSFIGYISQFDSPSGHFDDNILSFPFISSFLAFSVLNTISKRSSRQKRRGVKLDSLLKEGKKYKNPNPFLKDAGREFINFSLNQMQPLTVYSLATVLHSHDLGVVLGLIDTAGWWAWNKYKDEKGKLLNITLEKLADYSIPIGIATLPLAAVTMNIFDLKPSRGVYYLPYLVYLGLKASVERDLFKKSKNTIEGLLGKINKISLLGGLISAGVIEKLHINQFFRLNETDNGFIDYQTPDISWFLEMTAISAFFLKSSLISIANQEFKSTDNNFSIKNLISKPFLHYPLTVGVLSGVYGLVSAANQQGVSLNELSFHENMTHFLFYSIAGSLGSSFAGSLFNGIRNLPDYIKYYRNKINGNLEEAIKFYRRIVSRPCSMFVKKSRCLHLGGLLAENGRMEDAFLVLKKADDIDVKSIGFFRKMLNVFTFSNLEGKPDLENKRRLAILYSGLGKKEKARERWKECLSLADDLLHNCLYAEFLSKNGFEDADEQWHEVIKLISNRHFEIEGLDSTHVVKHVRGELLDYVLKFNGREELRRELDITSRLALAVRDHPEFLAPDPLTVFQDRDDWVLATKYKKHKEIDLDDLTQLKKVVEYMHLIYSFKEGDFKSREEEVVTLTKINKFTKLYSDKRFADLANLSLEMARPYLNGVAVINTDPNPLNWGVVSEDNRDKLFRCDLEPKESWHPFMDVYCLLGFSKLSMEQKYEIAEYYISGFDRFKRKELSEAGLGGQVSVSALRMVQIIPNLLDPRRKTREWEIDGVLFSLRQSLETAEENKLADVSRINRSLDYTYELEGLGKKVIVN